METITLNFDKAVLLNNWNQLGDRPGIYIHYIKDGNKNRIIYVGKANSIKDRNKDHFTNYDKKRYLLFTVVEDGLDFEYIPGYDHQAKTNVLKPDDIYVIGAYVSEAYLDEYNLEEIEGAISIHLFRSAENRKFLTTYKFNYGLRDKQLFFSLPNGLKLEGLPDFIETPKSMY